MVALRGKSSAQQDIQSEPRVHFLLCHSLPLAWSRDVSVRTASVPGSLRVRQRPPRFKLVWFLAATALAAAVCVLLGDGYRTIIEFDLIIEFDTMIDFDMIIAVSYTHLTLPTNREV